jgi:hypothetical protein
MVLGDPCERDAQPPKVENLCSSKRCLLAFCLCYFPSVCICLWIGAWEATVNLLNIHALHVYEHSYTDKRLTCSSQTPCMGQQPANRSCQRKPDNQVRKITSQRLFNLIGNFRHHWFLQSMVISIIDERNKIKKIKKEKTQGRKSWENVPTSLFISGWDCGRHNGFTQSAVPTPSWRAGSCRYTPSTKQELSTGFGGRQMGTGERMVSMGKATINLSSTWVWGLWIEFRSPGARIRKEIK